MSVALEAKKRVVAQKKAESEKMLVEIVQQQRIAEEQKKSVESDAAKIEIEEKESAVHCRGTLSFNRASHSPGRAPRRRWANRAS